MKHTVVIVDDHLLIAKAIADMISKMPDYQVLYEVENGKALQEKLLLAANVPDIVLLDINMPVLNGFETALWLRKEHPQVRIMALSMQDDEQSLIKMLQSGATGYLLKNVHPTELKKALDALVTNNSYYPSWVTGKIVASIVQGKSVADQITLTEREKELLRYCPTEMSYKEIAALMFCSPRTVESYRDSLFEKLKVKSRVGLAVYAMQNGYFEQ